MGTPPENKLAELERKVAVLEYLASAAIAVAADRTDALRDLVEEVHRFVQGDLSAAERGEPGPHSKEFFRSALDIVEKASTPD